MARQWIAVGLTSACNCACTLHFQDDVSCLTAPLKKAHIFGNGADNRTRVMNPYGIGGGYGTNMKLVGPIVDGHRSVDRAVVRSGMLAGHASVEVNVTCKQARGRS